MTEFTVAIADRIVGVTAIHESTRDYCGAYLSAAAPEFCVRMVPQDLALEREKAMREDALEGYPVRQYSDAYLETTALQRKITEQLFAYDTLLLHGSAIAVNGEAYLFTAKSGTGKSTHTRLWREMLGDRTVMVNDDKPFLRIDQEGVLVYGSPWNGKHNLGSNICVPLKAICILERREENEIHPISAQEALPMVFQQTYRAKNLGKYMEIIDKLTQRVKFYRLRCNMSPEAAEIAYEVMRI